MKYIFKSLLIIIFLSFHTIIFSQTENSNDIPQDSILKNNLETIRMKDQVFRLILPEIEMIFGKDSEELNYIWELMHSQDSINELAVGNIIEEYGWLGENRVGTMANQSLWLVIQHAPLETQDKYLPYLQESVELGESEGWYLAFLEDRILMRKGEKQIYGSQSTFNKETGKFHIYPIKDHKNVNERRKNIGLEPLEEYAEKNGYVLD